ncbi:MAG: ABC transporter permease [Bdellovibrionota bacterium]
MRKNRVEKTNHAPTRIFWSQVWIMTVSGLKARYRKTLAGFVWVVLNPLMMFGAQSYAFTKILKIQMPDYSKFLLAGLLPWIFISQSLDMSVALFVNSGRLLKSFRLHPLVFLFSQLLDNLVNFLAAFLLVLVPMLLLHPGASAIELLSLPLSLILLLGGTLGLAWLLATLHVFFRDTRYLVSFAISIAFFLTPIFYPLSFVPENIRWAVAVNPLFLLIQPFQLSVYATGDTHLLRALGMSALVAFSFIGLAAAFWSRRRNDVYLHI